MLRVVLDTNVVISGVHFGGIPRQILELAVDRHFLPLTSPSLLAELHRVLLVKFRYPPDAAKEVVDGWEIVAAVVNISERLTVVTADPDDNSVLECALAGQADTVVSGDKHLLALKTFRRISILTPQEFLTRFHQ